MTLEGGRLNTNPEDRLSRSQDRDRRDLNSLEAAAGSYSALAKQTLEGSDGVSIRDEVARFAKPVLASSGNEQYEQLERLVAALNLRKKTAFEYVPDEDYERRVFALALVQEHEASLH